MVDMSEQHSPQGAPDPAATPPPGPETPASASSDPKGGPPDAINSFFDSIRRMGLTRSSDRWIGGVASGIAERFGLDPLLVRAIFFVTFFISGAGLVLYGIGWALLPEKSDGRIHVQQAIRGHFDIAMLGAIAMVIVGLSNADRLVSWWDWIGLGWINGIMWLAAVGAVVWIVVGTVNQRKSKTSSPSTPSAEVPASYPATGAQPWSAVQDAPVTDDPDESPTGTAAYGAPVPPPAPLPAPTTPTHHPKPPKAPKPPKTKRVRGPGSVMTGIVIGLTLLISAGLLFFKRFAETDIPLALASIGVLVLLAGIGIVISGLRGRRSGVLGFLAIVGLVIGVPAAATWSQDGWVDRDWWRGSLVSSDTDLVTDPDRAASGLRVAFGSPTYDLTELDLSGATAQDPLRVPIKLAAGSVTILVPDGVPVQANVDLAAGSAEWRVDGEHRSVQGADRVEVFASEEVTADEGPVLILDTEIAAGSLTITER